MTKLIRHHSDRSFLSATGAWTYDILQAASWSEPEKEILLRSLPEAEIYYWFGEHTPTLLDISIPVTNRFAAPIPQLPC